MSEASFWSLVGIVRKAPSQKSFHTCQCPCRKSKSYMKTHSGLYCPTKESLSAISYKQLSNCKDPSITYRNSHVFGVVFGCMVSTSLSFNKHWNRDEKQQAEFSLLLDWKPMASTAFSRLSKPPGGTKNTPVGHAGAEAQSNYFDKNYHCLLSKSHRGYNWYNKKWK